MVKLEYFSKVYAVIPRFWEKTPTCPDAFLLSLPLRNLDVISQGHLVYGRIAKHGIICFTGTSSVSNI